MKSPHRDFTVQRTITCKEKGKKRVTEMSRNHQEEKNLQRREKTQSDLTMMAMFIHAQAGLVVTPAMPPMHVQSMVKHVAGGAAVSAEASHLHEFIFPGSSILVAEAGRAVATPW